MGVKENKSFIKTINLLKIGLCAHSGVVDHVLCKVWSDVCWENVWVDWYCWGYTCCGNIGVWFIPICVWCIPIWAWNKRLCMLCWVRSLTFGSNFRNDCTIYWPKVSISSVVDSAWLLEFPLAMEFASPSISSYSSSSRFLLTDFWRICVGFLEEGVDNGANPSFSSSWENERSSSVSNWLSWSSAL